MAKRKIIEINQELCNGCGQCVTGCAEGALELVDGKVHLVGEILCDGLGACLGECPTGALKLVEREAPEFDEAAVEQRLAATGRAHAASPEPLPLAGGCPGSRAQTLRPAVAGEAGDQASTLGHWPIKLQLLSPQAPFLKGSDLVLLADCAAASLPNLHRDVLPGKAIALACPKLDDPQRHLEKLVTVLAGAQPRSLTVLRMEVPCCGGLTFIAQKALAQAGLKLPLSVVVVGRDGRTLSRETMEAA